jgi:glucokinase
MSLMLLAGDIGGTKTLLGLYEPGRGARQPVVETEFHSADYPGLEVMVRDFLKQVGQTATYACFDVAGPVIRGRSHLTHLPWSLAEKPLARDLGLKRVSLLNDLKAIAYAVPRLEAGEYHTIHAGNRDPLGAMAVIAPGTGLGEAYLVWSGTEYIACSSEGGHTDFGPADEMQVDLWRYVAKKHGHVPYERVCSGLGIPVIYDFLRESRYAPEPPEFAERLASTSDRTPLITEAAQMDAAANPLCAAALQMFIAILGAEAGNLALKVLATGGVYLAGGIPPRLLPLLEDGRFMKAFVNKGRLADVLKDIPVHVVVSRAAMLGAVFYGFEHFGLS